MNTIILGAGISGLTTAIFLKLNGFSVSVYERSKSINTLGAGVVCWPNAMFVLKKLGLHKKIEKLGSVLTAMHRYNNKNELLGVIDINTINLQMNEPSVAILRKDLINILYEKASSLNIQFHFNYNVKSINDDTDLMLANVLFENGQSKTADLILGCDGRMNSQARKYVNSENTAVYSGFSNWIGIANLDENIDATTVQDFWGVGKRFGIVPISKNQCYWAAGLVEKNIKKQTSNSQSVNQKQTLFEMLLSFPDIVQTVINHSDENSIKKIFVYDHNPIDIWFKRNVLLMGDSAHAALPTSGQGACQALEDAWVLSELIINKTSKQNLSDIFQSFTEKRLKKTTGIIQSGRYLAQSIFNDDPVYCKQRNEQAKQTDYNKLAIGMANAWQLN
ncbi:MAG: FAD-dependent monooxygenase [Saccharospirillaceae bacterium]|nr:FAD-dependent monooxygenase [Pseudomonadales bacterium]NRB79806.1 FAD-dependent monooxygenase [Saccharospirillaceae bacterium]